MVKIRSLEKTVAERMNYCEPRKYRELEDRYTETMQKVADTLTAMNSMKIKKGDQETLMHILLGK